MSGPAPNGAHRRARSSTSAEILACAARRADTALVSILRSSSRPSPVLAEVISTGTSCRSSESSSRRRSARQSSACCGVSRSAWFSTTAMTSECPASGTRYRRCTAASAYFCGSSTQIIRSVSPTSRSAWLVAPVTTESWSGRSTRISPVIASSPRSSALDRAYRYRGATPSQSSSGPDPATLHTQACASLVAGRVTPTGEKSAPDSRLNSADLPLPVPPARATTVWLPDSRSRWSA